MVGTAELAVLSDHISPSITPAGKVRVSVYWRMLRGKKWFVKRVIEHGEIIVGRRYTMALVTVEICGEAHFETEVRTVVGRRSERYCRWPG